MVSTTHSHFYSSWKGVTSWWECVLAFFSALVIIRQWVCIAVHPLAGQHCHLMSHWPRPTGIFCSRAAHLMLAQAASTDPSVHTMCSGGQPDRVATVQPAGILNHPGSGGLSEKNLSFGSWISCSSLCLSLMCCIFMAKWQHPFWLSETQELFVLDVFLCVCVGDWVFLQI